MDRIPINTQRKRDREYTTGHWLTKGIHIFNHRRLTTHSVKIKWRRSSNGKTTETLKNFPNDLLAIKESQWRRERILSSSLNPKLIPGINPLPSSQLFALNRLFADSFDLSSPLLRIILLCGITTCVGVVWVQISEIMSPLTNPTNIAHFNLPQTRRHDEWRTPPDEDVFVPSRLTKSVCSFFWQIVGGGPFPMEVFGWNFSHYY